MVPRDINNNILLTGTSFSGVYQDESENWSLCEEMNIYIFWEGGLKPKNCCNYGAHTSSNNQHMKKCTKKF